jgi:hypothetical protein
MQDLECFPHAGIGVTFQPLGICHDYTMPPANRSPNRASLTLQQLSRASLPIFSRALGPATSFARGASQK